MSWMSCGRGLEDPGNPEGPGERFRDGLSCGTCGPSGGTHVLGSRETVGSRGSRESCWSRGNRRDRERGSGKGAHAVPVIHRAAHMYRGVDELEELCGDWGGNLGDWRIRGNRRDWERGSGKGSQAAPVVQRVAHMSRGGGICGTCGPSSGTHVPAPGPAAFLRQADSVQAATRQRTGIMPAAIRRRTGSNPASDRCRARRK